MLVVIFMAAVVISFGEAEMNECAMRVCAPSISHTVVTKSGVVELTVSTFCTSMLFIVSRSDPWEALFWM